MRKVEGFLFGGYWLVILGVITALFSGESSHHVSEPNLSFEGVLSRLEQFQGEFGSSWMFLSRERRDIAEFEGVSLLHLSKKSKKKKKGSKEEKKKKKEEDKKKKEEEKKKKKEEKKKKKEEKKKKKEEKKKEKEEKKKKESQEKKEKKNNDKDIKKQDLKDEAEIKKIGKKNGVHKKIINAKLKELKKQIKYKRKETPGFKLIELFETSGRFDTAGADSSSDSDSISSSEVSAEKKLTKREKKEQKKQDKHDQKNIKKRLLASGMNKKEASKYIGDLKKKLSKLRKSGNEQLTLLELFESSGDTDIEESEAGANNNPASISMLKRSVKKLVKENKKRKKEIRKLSLSLSKLAMIVKNRLTNSDDENQGLNSSSGDDE